MSSSSSSSSSSSIDIKEGKDTQMSWSELQPRTREERRELWNKYGQKAFAGKPTRTSKGKMLYHYPIYAKLSAPQRYQGRVIKSGALAAIRRAEEWHHPKEEAVATASLKSISGRRRSSLPSNYTRSKSFSGSKSASAAKSLKSRSVSSIRSGSRFKSRSRTHSPSSSRSQRKSRTRTKSPTKRTKGL
jgi:hypothetical protein